MKNVIILAAGKGTRMKSELPKCACPILGKPMIKYLVDACIDAGIDNIIVVVGYKKEIIKEVLKDYPNISYAFQEEQLGTGHACMVAKELLSSVNGTTIIVPGDMPLVGKDNLINILNYHEENNLAMTILSAIFDNPFSYGRIVRNSNNSVTAIVEEKECTEEQKLIKEINTGLYAVDNKTLFSSLELIDNNNSKNEYYLTDIVKVISKTDNVDAVVLPYDYHLIGINDVETLEYVEEKLKGEI